MSLWSAFFLGICVERLCSVVLPPTPFSIAWGVLMFAASLHLWPRA
jgi:hypothetical protein